MGSKLDQDPSSDFFFQEVSTSSIGVILLTNKYLFGGGSSNILINRHISVSTRNKYVKPPP